MTMTEEEIAREYRTAKAPAKMIGILAELNGCDRETVKRILTAQGETLPGNMTARKKAGKDEGTDPAGGGAPGEAARPAAAETPELRAHDWPQEPARKDGGRDGAGTNAAAGAARKYAVDVIADLLRQCSDREEDDFKFRERVYGLLALVHAMEEGGGKT